MSEKTTVSGGTSISTILLVVFIVLKLLKVIDWSWWWVLSPLWISVGLGIIFLIIFFLFMNK